jgi:type IV pilus assembly protein PilY1
MSAISSLFAFPANAQIDSNPPLPNVLLLVDSSGSMEYMPDGTLPATCDPANTSSDLNRWAALVEVLTGTVQQRSCEAVNRNSAAFQSEFSLGGLDPYDTGYNLPHHRIVSNGCVAGPGTTPVSVFDWPAGAINYHPWDNAAGTCTTPFQQATDGLLDTFRTRARFGLMTFDSSPDPGTGLSGGVANYQTGIDGLWSYFLDWQNTSTNSAKGRPAGCLEDQMLEVGARNAAAPPWEGRMIAFGRWNATTAQLDVINDHVQEALLAMRPYGATPLDGLLADARFFFRDDTDDDPADPGFEFGPRDDQYVVGGCRNQFAIVLSDGEPNLDMRPFCEGTGGVCPYPLKSYEMAAQLYQTGNPDTAIPVFAVGFGLSEGGSTQCEDLDNTDLQSGGVCETATGSLLACCNLLRIAWEGGTQKAYFADNVGELRNVLSQVMASITAQSTSRTMPAFVSVGVTQAGNTNAPAVAYEFTSSFDPRPGSLWSGNLERQRWVCEPVSGVLTPVLKPVEDNRGDDFTANINDGKLVRPREFRTFLGTQSTVAGNPFIDSAGTIRPTLVNNDGLGLYGGSPSTLPGGASDLATQMQTSPAAMGMFPMPPACSAADLAAANEAQCAYIVMNWELGGSNGANKPTRAPEEFGAIYHATPAAIGPPSAAIRDPAYEAFALSNSTRPLMLYSATTDGQLHAFKVASNDPSDSSGVLADELENNELWSFLPPHVLPNLLSQYSSAQQLLLDGTPVVKDVIFERSLNQAIAGSATWHTVLVAGGGNAGGFYYALDITNPTNPVFLWQISNTSAGGSLEPLFGTRSGTPAIATISYDDGSSVKEVGVAILPGGHGTLGTGDCVRHLNSFPGVDTVTGQLQNYLPRTSVRCWQGGPARSLTIVRLDTGEVLASFRGEAGDGPAALDGSRTKVVGFDSPITGEPVPFPSLVGQLADRIYVGDADGTLWRVDLSRPDPAQWRVHLAWDAYSAGDTPADGQPVETRPVISLDEKGNTIILYATGDQENFFTATTGMKNRVWSISEVPIAAFTYPFRNKENWFLNFDDGKRVTGPIALFDEVLYFATFTPQTGANVCSEGFGSIWGVDFVKFTSTAGGPRPLPRLPQDPNAVPIVFVDEQPQAAGTVVFGVAITQQPSCFETASVSDEYVGNYTQVTTAVPPRFVLKFHTGAQGTPNTGSVTNVDTLVLPIPRNTSIIDSWAAIIE